MSKRKILSTALTLCMIAILAVGGTLAYFTDTDFANNTFTVGNVNIKLIEQQRAVDKEGNKTTALEPFVQGKKLMPIVGSAQGEKDAIGLVKAENYVDKIITVAAEDKSEDAYIRVYLAVPSELDNVDPGKNVLHFNFGNKFDNGTYTAADHANWGAETLLTTGYEIDGVKYNIYYRTYNEVLAANEETGSAAYVGFYFDANVDYDATKGYTIGDKKIEFDFSKGITVPVYAIGAQAAGFEGVENAADAALNAAFGANYNPWAA